MDNERRHRSDVTWLWHAWINKRQDERAKNSQPWESDLYEWKAAFEAMTGYLIHQLRQARTGTLPTVHQQCSHSDPEPIKKPVLTCAMGVDVTACPILQSLYAFGDEQRDSRHMTASPEDIDELAARTCAWHIFTEKFRATEKNGYGFDTSEGYALDTSDRMFWDRVYANLQAPEGEAPE